MHSKKHRKIRQRIEAFKFQCRAARQTYPTDGGLNRRVAQIWRDFAHDQRAFVAKAKIQPHKRTLGIICEGLHRTKLPCGNHAVTGNPVTVRIEPRTKLS